MITIVDYGLGNVLAFHNLYKRLNVEVGIAKTPDDLECTSKVILPGVGSFDHAMELFDASGMRAALDELVLERGVPVLGVCVGMQMLARSSDEGKLPGLGWIPGHVKALKQLDGAGRMPLPHMGWNDIRVLNTSPLFDAFGDDARFYFLHSYYFSCDREADVLAVCNYGTSFPCAVNSANVYGVQFHPEKSHRWGARLLKNFSEL